MNVTENNIHEFANVDALLRNFFRAEMPDPWPTLKAPVESKFPTPVRAVPRRWHAIRGKLALAASIALLIVGSWCLTAGPGPDYSLPAGESPLGAPGGADRRFLDDYLNHKLNLTPKKTAEPGNSDGCDCCK